MKPPDWTPIALAAAGLLLSSCTTGGPGAAAPAGGPAEAAAPAPPALPVPDALPVYAVVQDGASPAQVEGLARSLGISLPAPAGAAPTVAYTDPSEYLVVPSHPVTDPAQLAKLREMARREPPDAVILFDAIDADAVRRIAVYDSQAALQGAAAAFASAGLPLASATPSVRHTVLTASYADGRGSAVSVTRQLDTRVAYRFASAAGIPFTGPGAVLEVAYNGAGKAIALHYAWRELREGEPVKVIPEREARRRIAGLLPPGARIDLRLVYWCPPFANPAGRGSPLLPAAIIPWYAFTATVEVRDPASGRVSLARTRERLIPATDDATYIPSIPRLDVAGSGLTRVEAGIGVSGGRPPYTITWTGSNPEVLSNRTREASYVPLARAVPPPDAGSPQDRTVASMETISVTATDANGIAASARLTIPVQARPITPVSRGAPGGWPLYGCESPGEPEEWVQERVGWQEGMGNPGGGDPEFCWRGDDSWPGDYIRPSPAATLPARPWIHGDADYADWGVDTANLVLINGDAWPDGFTAMFPGAPESDYNHGVDLLRPGYPGGTVLLPGSLHNVPYAGSWGTAGPNDRLYWLAGLLCDALDETDSDGLTPSQRWGPAFGGLHMFTGFASPAAYSAGAFPKAFAENILGVSGPPQTILEAWFNASTSTGEGSAAAMGPIAAGGVSDLGDHYVGKGARGPSIGAAAIAGWWYLRQ